GRSVILRGNDYITVKLGNFLLPALRHLILRGCPGRRSRLVKKWHRVIAEVDDLDFHVASRLGDLGDPCRRLFREPAGARGADDDSDLGFAHRIFPLEFSTFHKKPGTLWVTGIKRIPDLYR